MRHLKPIFAAFVLLSPHAANATVIYEFSAFSSFDFAGPEVQSGGFVVETSHFITSDTSFDSSDLLSCSVVFSSGPGTCGQQGFVLDLLPGYDTIQFGYDTGSYYYYFADGAFGAAGTYDTLLFFDDQAGRLIVNQVSEPATLILLAAGLLAAGFRNNARRT